MNKHCTCEYAGPGMLEKMCPMHEAAPELLEALEALIAVARDTEANRDWRAIEQADAVIAKARGES